MVGFFFQEQMNDIILRSSWCFWWRQWDFTNSASPWMASHKISPWMMSHDEWCALNDQILLALDSPLIQLLLCFCINVSMNERVKANLFLMRSSPFVLVKWFHMHRQGAICWRSELDSSCGVCKIWILIAPLCSFWCHRNVITFYLCSNSPKQHSMPMQQNDCQLFCVSWLFC
jgi:hypothetical protein